MCVCQFFHLLIPFFFVFCVFYSPGSVCFAGLFVLFHFPFDPFFVGEGKGEWGAGRGGQEGVTHSYVLSLFFPLHLYLFLFLFWLVLSHYSIFFLFFVCVWWVSFFFFFFIFVDLFYCFCLFYFPDVFLCYPLFQSLSQKLFITFFNSFFI